jgi:hypothetical protein
MVVTGRALLLVGMYMQATAGAAGDAGDPGLHAPQHILHAVSGLSPFMH